MSDVKAIEDSVKALPAHDLAHFSRWFAESSATSKIDHLLQEAEEDHQRGGLREL